MFDVGFSELLVIGVVALLVLGPEKLPRVARTVGALMGRAQRYVNDVKADINREIELDEIRKLKTSVTEAAQSIESSVRDTVSSFEAQANELNALASGVDPVSGMSQDAAPAAATAEAAAPSAEALQRATESIEHSLSTAAADPAQGTLALDDPASPAPPKSA